MERRKGIERMGRQMQRVPELSEREKEVVSWLKKGKSSWEVSVILNITERTVNFHVRNIMHKLNAVSRTQAVAVAMEQGLTFRDNH